MPWFEIILTSSLVIVVGVPFTLWWWKQADKWADREHQRFPGSPDTRERIAVKDPAPPDAS